MADRARTVRTTLHNSQMDERSPTLAPSIFIRCVSTRVEPSQLQADAGVLDREERERLASFHAEVHRNRFLVGRAMLRRALGQHMGCDPALVRFVTGENGKPRAFAPDGTAGPHFNFSRSGDWAAVAVATGYEVGLDIECFVDMPDLEPVAETAFSTSELAYWTALSEPERLVGFYRIWTRKEALTKATGDGLTNGPQTISVPVAVLAPHQVRPVEGWALGDYMPAADVIGAVVIADRTGTLSHYEDERIDDTSVLRTFV